MISREVSSDEKPISWKAWRKNFSLLRSVAMCMGKPATSARKRRRRRAEEERGMVSHSEAWGMAFSAYRRAVSPRKRKLSTRFCLPDRLSGISIMES